MAALLHRKPAFAKTCHDSCSAQDSIETNTPYENRNFAYWVFNRCEIWSFTLREECTLRIPKQDTEENILIQREEVIDWRKLHVEELHNFLLFTECY